MFPECLNPSLSVPKSFHLSKYLPRFHLLGFTVIENSFPPRRKNPHSRLPHQFFIHPSPKVHWTGSLKRTLKNWLFMLSIFHVNFLDKA